MLDTLKDIGLVLFALLGIALFIIPDPIGKAVELWRMFRD